MKKVLNASEAKFLGFLEIVNLIHQANGSVLDLNQTIEQKLAELPEDGNDDDAYKTERRRIIRDTFEAAVESAVSVEADKSTFCMFVLGRASVDQIIDYVPFKGMDFSLGMESTYESFQVFRRSFVAFKEVMERRSLAYVTWATTIELPAYISQRASLDIEVTMHPYSLFYGFREFSRVLQCALESCSKYFLVTRKGKIYCTESCSTKARVQRFEENVALKKKHLDKRNEFYKQNKGAVARQQAATRDRKRRKK